MNITVVLSTNYLLTDEDTRNRLINTVQGILFMVQQIRLCMYWLNEVEWIRENNPRARSASELVSESTTPSCLTYLKQSNSRKCVTS